MMHISKGLSKLNLDSIAPELNLPLPNNSNQTQTKPNKPNKPPILVTKGTSGGIGTDALDETPPPSVLKQIDYTYLEKHQLYKYYPSYFHNDGITTPELRDLIIDKPIYNEANKHVKKTKKRKSVKSKQDKDEDKVHSLKEARQLRKEQREERKELRKEQRDERKDLKQRQKSQSQSSQPAAQSMKKNYSGHYMNKVSRLSTANGGSNEIAATHGFNPYQMKTQFSNNKTNGEDYYWNQNQPMSRANSQFSNVNNNNGFSMKRIDSSSTSSDEGLDCAELDPRGMARKGSGVGGGYDSERTEVEDDFNSIAFNNPFDFGKKLSNVGSTMKEEGAFAPASSTSMSNSSSYNNYPNGPSKAHQNSLFSNQQYSYLYSSRTNSRNNSVAGPTENYSIPSAAHQRRSSSVTLINNSQNASQNRYNTTNGNSVPYGTHHISQPKRNNSIATKFMSMFKSDSEDSNTSSNGKNQYYDDEENNNDDDDVDNADDGFVDIDENGNESTTAMMRKGSIKHHKTNNLTMSRRQSVQPGDTEVNGFNKPKAGPLAAAGPAGASAMAKSNSFDQTKSQRTKLKNKLKMKFTNESRRYSEQFGMYKF